MAQPCIETAQNNARRLCLALAVLAALSGLGLAAFAWRLGPPVGDLTRISGLSETRHGWHRTAQRYVNEQFRKLPLETLLAEGPTTEIIVFGDSFTDAEHPGTSWLNALHSHTGATIAFTEYTTLTDVMALIAQPSFQAHPPKAMIVEMGERTVFQRARPLMQGADCAQPRPPVPFAAAPVPAELEPWTRRTVFKDFDELLSWGALALRRRVFADGETVVVKLDRDDVFSSTVSDELLIFEHDISRHTPDTLLPLNAEDAGAGIVCAMRHVINAAPLTEIYVLVAPDKRTVYAPWTVTELPPKALDIHGILSGMLNGRYISPLEMLQADVDAAVKDVYYPNDTHWSDETARKIGKVAAGFISD